MAPCTRMAGLTIAWGVFGWNDHSQILPFPALFYVLIVLSRCIAEPQMPSKQGLLRRDESPEQRRGQEHQGQEHQGQERRGQERRGQEHQGQEHQGQERHDEAHNQPMQDGGQITSEKIRRKVLNFVSLGQLLTLFYESILRLGHKRHCDEWALELSTIAQPLLHQIKYKNFNEERFVLLAQQDGLTEGFFSTEVITPLEHRAVATIIQATMPLKCAILTEGRADKALHGFRSKRSWALEDFYHQQYSKKICQYYKELLEFQIAYRRYSSGPEGNRVGGSFIRRLFRKLARKQLQKDAQGFELILRRQKQVKAWIDSERILRELRSSAKDRERLQISASLQDNRRTQEDAPQEETPQGAPQEGEEAPIEVLQAEIKEQDEEKGRGKRMNLYRGYTGFKSVVRRGEIGRIKRGIRKTAQLGAGVAVGRRLAKVTLIKADIY